MICLATEAEVAKVVRGGDINYHEPVHQRNEAAAAHTAVPSPSRRIIGFVTAGQFSFLHGHGMGIGFCSARGLADAFIQSWTCGMDAHTAVVLVRNVTSRTYRVALMCAM